MGKNAKIIPFFYKERERTQKNVPFFYKERERMQERCVHLKRTGAQPWKERVPNPEKNPANLVIWPRTGCMHDKGITFKNHKNLKN